MGVLSGVQPDVESKGAPAVDAQKGAFETAPAYPPMAQGYPAHGYPAQQQQQPWGQQQQQAPYMQHANAPPMVAHNVPTNNTSVQAAHHQSCGSCFNMQWVLFILGWFFFFPAALGVVLPACSRGRLSRDPSYRLGWIGNCVLAALWILAAILTSILVHNSYRNGINNGNTGNYIGYTAATHG